MDLPGPDVVRADFDRIATATAGARTDAPDAIDRWAELALAALPPRCRRVLDVGCGTGALARRLAARAGHVDAIDLSPVMVATAVRLAAGRTNLALHVADAMTWQPPARYQAVVSVATLHHLPLAAALRRLAAWLEPGGRLIVVDLYQASGAGRVPFALASCLDRVLTRHPDPALAAAWRAHGHHDRLLPIAAVRRAAAVVPGARVRRHRRWRYSLVWTRR